MSLYYLFDKKVIYEMKIGVSQSVARSTTLSFYFLQRVLEEKEMNECSL